MSNQQLSTEPGQLHRRRIAQGVLPALRPGAQKRIQANASTTVHRQLHIILRGEPLQYAGEDRFGVLLGTLDGKRPKWFEAVADIRGHVYSVKSSREFYANAVMDEVRLFAVSTLVNELLRRDQPNPRPACITLVSVALANATALLPSIERGFRNEFPEPDAALIRNLHGQLKSMQTHLSATNKNERVTIATLRRLGNDPRIEVVYRDPGPPGTTIGEVLIAKIGNEPHAYFPLFPNDSAWFTGVRGFPFPLCFVGDLRCAVPYRTWPL